MNVDEQVVLLRNQYLIQVSRIYETKFQMRLMSVVLFDQNKYSKLIKTIEVISAIIEQAYVDCNPQRMLYYLVILRSRIDDLENKIDNDYNRLWDRKLSH